MRFCPKCKSMNIIDVRGNNTMWRCIDCKLEMAIFPEKEIKNIKTKK